MKALITDDSLINVKLLKSFLEMQDVEVKCTTDSIESITMCQQELFDIIFLDYHMPILNGSEVAREIRKTQNAKSKIILVTGEEKIAVKRNLPAVDEYLLKPYDYESICELLKLPIKIS